MGFRRVALVSAFFVSFSIGAAQAQQSTKGGITSIQQEPLKEWLTYIASDELQGRATYSEGPRPRGRLHLEPPRAVGRQAGRRRWDLPAGRQGPGRPHHEPRDGDGRGQRPDAHVQGRRRHHVPEEHGRQADGRRRPGAVRRLRPDAAVGQHDDYAKVDPKGKVVVWLGRRARRRRRPDSSALLERVRAQPRRDREGRDCDDRAARRRVRRTRPRRSAPAASRGYAPPRLRRRRRRPAAAAVAAPRRRRLHDRAALRRQGAAGGHRARTSSSSSSSADPTVKYAELKEKAAKQEPLPPFALKGVKLTFNVDADYTIVRTRLTHNVVGIVEGSDPKLKDTYVAFGAHYDHVGYREGVAGRPRRGRRRPIPTIAINNGADDDGSGTVAIMAIARAFAQGPRPKRSLLFVWHAGEENGPARLALQRRLSGRADREDRRAAQHGHGRPQPQRRSEAGEHRLRRRLRSHQHRAAQHQRGRQRVARQADDAGLRDERSGGHRVDLHAQRSLQLRVEGDSDHLLLHRPASRLSPRRATASTRSSSTRSSASRSSPTRPAAASPTWITRPCGTTRGRGWGRR